MSKTIHEQLEILLYTGDFLHVRITGPLLASPPVF